MAYNNQAMTAARVTGEPINNPMWNEFAKEMDAGLKHIRQIEDYAIRHRMRYHYVINLAWIYSDLFEDFDE